MRAVGRHIRNFGFTYVYFFGLVLLGGSIFFAAGHYGSGSQMSLGLLLFCTLYGAGITAVVIRWCVDCRRFWRFRNNAFEIAPADFLVALGSFRYNSFRVRFIRLISGNLLLPVNDQSISIIRNLRLALDRDLARRPEDPVLPTGFQTVDHWRKYYTDRRRVTRKFGLRQWGNAVLDELSGLEQRLVERRRIADLPPESSMSAFSRAASTDAK